ncbi:MAG: (2Fe-2S)-binding protein, partial [Thiobacillus sp.]
AGLAGRTHDVMTLRVGHAHPVPDELLAELDAALGLADPLTVMHYEDRPRGISKRVRVDGGRVVAARLTGETAAFAWLREVAVEGVDAQAIRAWVLAPVAHPPAGGPVRGRVICNCFDVAEAEIVAAAAAGAGADLGALQSALKCGTECGSCLPELKRLLAAGRAAA